MTILLFVVAVAQTITPLEDRVRIHNATAQPVALRRVTVKEVPLRLSPEAVALVLSGWQGPSNVRRIAAAKLVSKTVLQIWDPARGEATQVGFTTFDRADAYVEIEGGVARAVCDFNGYLLAPGATVESERVEVMRGGDPVEALHQWASRVQRHYRPRIWPTTPVGWVGWSWVDGFHHEKYEDVVRRNAAAIRARLRGFEVPYLWVSLGNLRDREPGNWLVWNEELFPSGPRKLVADLREQDFTLGLWAGIFWMSSRLKQASEELRLAFLQSEGKPITVAHRELGDQFVLDPTHPRAQEFIARTFRAYREWGIRYYMIDFLYSVSNTTPGRFLPDAYANAKLVPAAEAYREGLRVIREAVGPDTYLLSSTGPTLQNVGLVDGARVGTDYGEGRPLDGPGKAFWPATFVVNRPDFWTSHRRATDALATHFFTHRKLFLADSGNVLTIDKPVPANDARITATIFGINGSPMMMGDDIDRMSPERLAMLKQLLPRSPEAAEPLDLFTAPEPGYPKVFRVAVETPWEKYSLYAIFNYGDEILQQTVALREPGRQTVWDFWEERQLGMVERELRLTVAPRSVKLVRVAPERSHPWLLSTDLHIRQGQSEIESVEWKDERLTVVARRPAGESGNLFLRVPKGRRLKEPRGWFIAKDGNDEALIVRAPVNFDAGGRAEVRIEFTGADR